VLHVGGEDSDQKGSEVCFHLLCVMEGGRREDIGASMLHVCMQK